jgi:hypothetical protein
MLFRRQSSQSRVRHATEPGELEPKPANKFNVFTKKKRKLFDGMWIFVINSVLRFVDFFRVKRMISIFAFY